jgi:hypothetical protein
MFQAIHTYRQKYSLYVRIGISLLFAYLISHFLVTEIFLSYTPQIRPDLPQYAVLRIGDTVEGVRTALTGEDAKSKPTIAGLKSRLQQIAPGVRASERANATYTEVDLDNVAWKRVTYTLSDGRTITITIPENEQAPSIDMMKEAYQ